MLIASSLNGVKMRPDEIEALMAAMRQPKVAHTLVDEDFTDDGNQT